MRLPKLARFPFAVVAILLKKLKKESTELLIKLFYFHLYINGCNKFICVLNITACLYCICLPFLIFFPHREYNLGYKEISPTKISL